MKLGCKQHDDVQHDCHDCHKAAFIRACLPLMIVSDSKMDRPASEVLAMASKLAEKMERMEAEGVAEWSNGLAAEAIFDLVHVDKNPLPTHFALLNPQAETTSLPTLLGQLLGRSNSEMRRLIGGGGLKINGEPVTEINVETESLDKQTVVAGKQGKAVFCHFPLPVRFPRFVTE